MTKRQTRRGQGPQQSFSGIVDSALTKAARVPSPVLDTNALTEFHLDILRRAAENPSGLFEGSSIGSLSVSGTDLHYLVGQGLLNEVRQSFRPSFYITEAGRTMTMPQRATFHPRKEDFSEIVLAFFEAGREGSRFAVVAAESDLDQRQASQKEGVSFELESPGVWIAEIPGGCIEVTQGTSDESLWVKIEIEDEQAIQGGPFATADEAAKWIKEWLKSTDIQAAVKDRLGNQQHKWGVH